MYIQWYLVGEEGGRLLSKLILAEGHRIDISINHCDFNVKMDGPHAFKSNGYTIFIL